MKTRCTNPRTHYFKNYGGRGITVCERWAGFELFLADMGECPEGCTLERKDVNGNYEPGNCIWIPAADQHLNMRKTLRVMVDGKPMTACGAARLLGVKYWKLIPRIHKLGAVAAIEWAQSQHA